MADKLHAFGKVLSVINDDTRTWWEHARAMYEHYPESVPDAMYPLLDEQWPENEIMVTRSEMRYIQAWATGLVGWSSQHPALDFSM
jgi:hypothetical protein